MAQIVTITNPLTGQPAQVDQLDHTAQQIDDAIARALPGGAIDTALQKKADASSVYTKEESISAETRTALNLAETATPDAALAEIARQLSESGNIRMDLLWENASPTSAFTAQTISLDLSNYDYVYIVARERVGEAVHGYEYYTHLCKVNGQLHSIYNVGMYGLGFRRGIINTNGIVFEEGKYWSYKWELKALNDLCIPLEIYGIRIA